MPWYFSVGFHWSVGRLKGRSDERRSVATDTCFSIMNHSNETISILCVASDRISIRIIIVYLLWVRLGPHNGGQALRIKQTEGLSAAARVGWRAEG